MPQNAVLEQPGVEIGMKHNPDGTLLQVWQTCSNEGMMRHLSRIDQIAFGDLVERAHDVQFFDQFSEKGSFTKFDRRGREYWYHRVLEPQEDGLPKLKAQYVGPVDDIEGTKRVENWMALKADYVAHRKLASQLRRSGLPAPAKVEGEIIDHLAKNGLFRLRARRP